MQNHTTMKTILASRVKEEINDWLSTGKRLIPILFLLLFGVGNVWGDTNINFSGGYIYFADTYNVHKGSTQLCGRKSNCSNGDWYTAVTTLNNIGHTKLYYTNSLEGSGWSNVCWAGWALISNSSAKSNADTEYWKGTNSTWYSNFDTYGLNSGSTYLITVASASKGATKTTSYLGNSNTQYTSLNHSQTVYKYTSTNGGSTYSAASINSGTVTISAYKMTGNGTASNSSNSATINTASTTSASKDAAYTGEVTLTASANTGYTFVGWFETASGGSALSTSSEYTYNAPNSTKSIYARFVAEETHDVTVYYKYGSTTVKTSTTESAVGVTTERTFTAPDVDGYNFFSYEFGSGLTMKSANTTTNPCRFVTKASGDYELTTNYNIAPVKMYYGNTSTFANSSYSSMTYDATKKAYYVDVTTNSKPYYFRFDFNTDTKELAGDWSDAGYPNVNEVTANGSKVACATDVKGWTDKSSLKFDGANGSSIRIWFSYKDKQAWITEATYTVTITNDGNGTTSPASVTAGKNTTSGDATATPDDDHAFLNWTIPSGVTAASGYSATSNPIRIKATASSKSITANFQNRWIMKGSGGVLGNWDTDKEMTKSATNTYSVTLALVAGTSYSFKFYDRKASKWYGKTSTTITKTLGSLTKDITSIVEGSGSTYNMNFTPTLSGDYTFTYDSSTGTLTIGWPDITKLEIISGSGVSAGYYDFSGPVGTVYSKSFTFNKNQRYSAKIVYHSDFYTFDNTSDMTIDNHTDWRLYNNVSDKICNVYAPVAGTYTYQFNSNNSGNTTLTVVFPTAYTVTFGAGAINGSNSAISVTASPTFSSGDYVLAETDITFSKGSTISGYTWKGWYSNNDGTGTLHSSTDANLSWTATRTGDISVYACYNYATYTATMTTSDRTGYGSGAPANQTATYTQAMPTITPPTAANGYCFMGYWDDEEGVGTQYYNANGTSAHVWDKTSGATLYAYFKKAEITGITFSPAAAEPGDEVTATATISPTPSGTTTVCWEVRYASNDIPLSPQPTLTPASGASVTLTAPPAAVYKFVATLKTGNDCSGGTVLDTENANLTVAGSHPVTIRYKHGDVVIKEETIQNIHATVATGISAPNIIGYSFSSWTLGDGITKVSGNLTDPSITVTAIYDGVITANYNPKRMIYFYNSLGWSSVNVYFYKNDSYWNNTNGTGADQSYTFSNTPYSEGKHGTMTRIDGTDIWYFDCEAAGVNASYDDVVFTELNQHGYGYFAKTDGKQNKVVRRGDYKSSMPMFVPVEQDGVSMNGGLAIYYDQGYWMNYPENTGYTVRIYNAWNADKTSPAREYYFPYSSDKKMPLKLDVEFNTTDAKWFMIYRNDGVYLSVNAEMTQASHTNYRIKDSNDKIKIQPSAPGIYTYTLTFYDDGEKDGSGKAYGNMYHITVDYPVSVGDYRILYSDNAEWSQGWAHNSVGHAWCHPSDAVNKISAGATEAKKDTVSLFVSYGASPSAKFQYVSAINPSTGAVTWSDVAGGTISLSSITKSGTYNFIVTQPVGGASVSVEKIEAYTGNYYIRTDCAGNTKWDSYRAANHQMTYSEFSCSEANSFGEKFSHYFTHWCPAGMNVKFVIANDYSSCITDSLIQDVGNPYANINSDGFLNSDGNPEETANRFSANIRFMYNEATNKISRAYVASSTNDARWFLVLRSNTEIQDEAGYAMEDIGSGIPSVILDDKQNWIYEQTLKILPGSKFKLFACYAEVTPSQSGAQYFRGYWASDDWANSANTIELVGGDPASGYQLVRVLYDFKTNRLVCAWLPSGAVTGEIDINADVMIIREHQEDATLITFTNPSSKLTDVKTVYGTMKFNRWVLNNKSSAAGHAVLPVENQKSIYERALYFISFPFDVNLGEVFGFGTYGVHWIIENYDGENRAKNGYWIDSPPNWKYVTSSKGYTLKANKGYILCLDLDLMKDDNEEFWPHGIETVELFFPSAVTQSTIEQGNVTIPAPDPAVYQCTINRPGTDGDRRVKDSYWRCLGVPSFANYTTTLSDGTRTITWQTADNTLPYLYAWNMENNTLEAQSTSTFAFKTMHAYLTQCSTAIVWTAASKPTPIAARQSDNEMLKDREFRLELAENDVKADQAYIRLSAREDVTTGFEFGNDLSKEFNSGVSNIYTLIGNERAAANSLPLSTEQTTIVPVGILANAAGDYTFSMPGGTDGIGVTLVDNETGIHTQLGALDYTVTLEKGDYTNRFFLEISPIKSTPTGLENQPTSDSSLKGRAQKKVIDGILYIVKDGKIFDARGARLR